ncbi:MAG: hypothetical protein EA408_04280 [Marinilabiliales bacterium]|nr:MAG: hypothetical protein EA408_04280 [Marinilabiliales bacterium]
MHQLVCCFLMRQPVLRFLIQPRPAACFLIQSRPAAWRCPGDVACPGRIDVLQLSVIKLIRAGGSYPKNF